MQGAPNRVMIPPAQLFTRSAEVTAADPRVQQHMPLTQGRYAQLSHRYDGTCAGQQPLDLMPGCHYITQWDSDCVAHYHSVSHPIIPGLWWGTIPQPAGT